MYGGVHFSSTPDFDNVARIDHNCLPMIAAMHRYGIRIDILFLRALGDRVTVHKLEAESQLRQQIGNAYQDFDGTRYTPFNPASPYHVARLLFHHIRVQGTLPVPLTKKTKRESTDEETLEMYRDAHPACGLILELREYDKLLGTYIRPILSKVSDRDPYLHTQFSPTTAATGRLSSKQPNLQNIPVRTKLGREVRNAFIASPGCVLVSTDLSQIEMRWAAYRSQDSTMLSVFQKGEDIHNRTTCNVFGLDYDTVDRRARRVDAGTATDSEKSEHKHFKQYQRLPCKTVGFGVLYGQTAKGLQKSLATEGVAWSEEDCTALIETKFFGVYPALKEMLARDHSTARRYAMIWDDFGRVRLVPEAKSAHRRIAEEGIRKAGNHPEQAGAQGTEKIGMAELFPLMESISESHTCRPVLQIHDDCLSDVDRYIAREYADIAQYTFENASPLDGVPVKSSVGVAERWGDL